MAVTKSLFGKSPEGKEISLYTLSNSKGMKADRKSTRLNSSHPNPSRMPSSA